MHSNLCFGSAVVFGKNCIEKNKNRLLEYGKKCLVVTSKSGAKKSGALDDVNCALKSLGIEYCIFDKITENPLVSTVIRVAGLRGSSVQILLSVLVAVHRWMLQKQLLYAL